MIWYEINLFQNKSFHHTSNSWFGPWYIVPMCLNNNTKETFVQFFFRFIWFFFGQGKYIMISRIINLMYGILLKWFNLRLMSIHLWFETNPSHCESNNDSDWRCSIPEKMSFHWNCSWNGFSLKIIEINTEFVIVIWLQRLRIVYFSFSFLRKYR